MPESTHIARVRRSVAPSSAWRAVAAGLLVLVIALAVVEPGTARAEGYLCEGAQVFVLEQDLDRTLVEIRWDVRPARTLGSDSFALALPTSQLPTVRILELDAVPLDEPIDVDGLPVFTDGAPYRIRNQWIAAVEVRNVFFGVDGASQLQRALVEFDHPAPAALHARASRSLVPTPGSALRAPSSGVDELVVGAVVNARAARIMRHAAPARALPEGIEDTFSRSPNWLRIEVDGGGIVRLDYATLRSAMGPDVDLVQAGSLRLFGASARFQPEMPSDGASSWRPSSHLRERPIRVEAAGSTLAAGDVLFAYLPGPDGWVDRFDPDAPALAHEEHPYASTVSYWLTWDEVGGPAGDFDVAPLRMAGLDGSPDAADVVRTDARVRTHHEENVLPGFGIVRDDWMWRNLVAIDASETFRFQLAGVVSDSLGWLATEPGMENTPSDNDVLRARYTVNGTVVGEPEWSASIRFSLTEAPFHFSTGGVPLVDGGNQLVVTNTTSTTRTTGALPTFLMDFFTLSWRHDLRWRGEPLAWYVPATESSTGRWRFELDDPQGRLDGVHVYDVTDPWAPIRVNAAEVAPDGSSLSFGVDLFEGRRRHFLAVPADAVGSLSGLESGRPRLLRAEVRDGGAGWDMVVLHPSEFEEPAERLAAMRRENLDGRSAPRVSAVDVQDVYDQFGHGSKDPSAIRNYLKFLFEVDPRIEFALLLGDADRDARGRTPSAGVDHVPTFVSDQWPRGKERFQSLVPFARDDYLGSLDDPPRFGADVLLDLPDVATGRLPARTRTEADFLVQRVIDYETSPSPGPWRNLLLLAADDEVGLGPNDWREEEHVTEAECVAFAATPPGLDKDKLYLTEFPNPPNDLAKPAARIAMRERWSDGRAIVHYVGHGAPEQMADEVLFRIEDVTSLSNGSRLPLFLAFSCDVSIFDDGAKRSMTEALVSHRGGGAIATIAATQVTYVSANENLTEAFYASLFPDPEFPGRPSPRMDRSAPLGRALMVAKWSVPGVQESFHLRNNAKYVLLGDPALRLQTPRETLELGGSLSETVQSGREQSLTVEAPAGLVGSGTWYVDAKEAADSVTYVMDRERPGSFPQPIGELPYVLEGNTFYRGTGSFGGGSFEATLRAPTVMRLGPTGRVRVLMEAGTEQFLGVADSLDVVRAALDTDDREGPRIELGFERGARRVQPGSVLEAVLEDPSGINVIGNAPATSILLEFDDSGISTDVTDRFELDPDTFTRGRLEVPLPEDIEPGPHVLTLRASDTLSNVGSARLEFEVVLAGETGIGQHAPIPNPFVDSTTFVVDVLAPVGLSSRVEIDIRALDGSPVRRLRTTLPGGDGRLTLDWDGRDARGDEVANGTYLYVLRVEFATEPARVETSTGRVVLMR